MLDEEKKVIIYWSTKKTISLVCAILLIPTLIIFVFSVTLKTTLLNTNYYKNNLKKIDAYNRLINDGIPSLILDSKISDNALTDTFAKELAIFIIQKSVDPAWVENQSEKLVDKIAKLFANYNGDAKIDLTETKNIVEKTSTGLLLVDSMIPTCEEAKKADNSKTLLGKTMDAETNCKVKADLAMIRDSVSKINVGIVNLDSEIKNANSFITGIKHFTTNINLFFWLSLAVIIALLALIIILEFHNLAFVTKSISISLITASAISFFGALIINSFASTAYTGLSANTTGPIKAIASDFVAALIGGVFNRMEIISAIIFAVFLAILVITIVLEKSGSKIFKHPR